MLSTILLQAVTTIGVFAAFNVLDLLLRQRPNYKANARMALFCLLFGLLFEAIKC